MLQFQSRHYVIALSADWLTQILKHTTTPHWCKITITRSLEGARYDAIPECPWKDLKLLSARIVWNGSYQKTCQGNRHRNTLILGDLLSWPLTSIQQKEESLVSRVLTLIPITRQQLEVRAYWAAPSRSCSIKPALTEYWARWFSRIHEVTFIQVVGST